MVQRRVAHTVGCTPQSGRAGRTAVANAALDNMPVRQSSPLRTGIWRSTAQPGCLTARQRTAIRGALPRCDEDGVGTGAGPDPGDVAAVVLAADAVEGLT